MNKRRTGSAEHILLDRENRAEFIKTLAAYRKRPVVTGRLNYPGPNKNTGLAKIGFEILLIEMEKTFLTEGAETLRWEGADGPAYILSIDDDLLKLKRKSILMEKTHPLGRLFDIDVTQAEGRQVSRCTLNLPERICFVCGQNAHVCASRGLHSQRDLIRHCNNLITQFTKPASARKSHG